MQTEYLGHSSFFIKGKSFSVVTDPFKGIGYDIEKVSCDYAISSHAHFDHDNFGGVDAKHNVTTATDIFRVIDSYHDDAQGKKRGKNRVYIFRVDGIKFCHMGDIGEMQTLEKLKKESRIDVLFIPVGGTYTINAEEAMRYIDALNPKIAIPMHYKSGASNLDIATIDKFLNLAKNYKFVGKVFNIDEEILRNIENTQIWIAE